ncbi:MAG: DUF3781 domain-containing protein [Clostridia bacterium]|nr:DUF3781 domain-containing protein [Clostridia bacterium]
MEVRVEKLLIQNIDNIHTTSMGVGRIKKNLSLDTDDVVKWCKEQILENRDHITKKGKNWYIATSEVVITVNSYSYTIITAHTKK